MGCEWDPSGLQGLAAEVCCVSRAHYLLTTCSGSAHRNDRTCHITLPHTSSFLNRSCSFVDREERARLEEEEEEEEDSAEQGPPERMLSDMDLKEKVAQ